MSKWDTVQVSPDTMHYKLDIKTDSRDDTKVGLLYTGFLPLAQAALLISQ